jgi:multiple sugar transport system permease protein
MIQISKAASAVTSDRQMIRPHRATMGRRQLWGLLFVLPVVLGTVLFNVLPAAFSLALSLTDWDLIGEASFIGIQNYIRMFSEDKLFATTLFNTAYFTFGSIPLTMVAGLVLALLINQKIPGRNIFRAAFFVPVVASEVAVAMIWNWVFNTDYGLLNQFLGNFGIEHIGWLHEHATAMPAVIIVSVWKGMGYNMVLFLAGLQSIPTEFYEAARIDGAGAWQSFRRVTLPLLSPTTFFILIISVINSFQVFGLLYIMTGGGPGRATTVYVYYLWENAFRLFRMGYAAALAFVLFTLIGLVTMFQWWVSKKWVHYNE